MCVTGSGKNREWAVSIAYSQRGAKGRVSIEPQEQYNEKARAFLSLDRKTAMQMHPDLRKDYQTLDSAYQKMESQGVSENSRSEVMHKLRHELAQKITERVPTDNKQNDDHER